VSLSENARGRAVLAINGHGYTSMVRIAVRPAGKRRFKKAVRITPTDMRASFAEVAVHTDGSTTLVAPTTDDHGSAGILAATFVRPRQLDYADGLIAPRGATGKALGANNRGDAAVLFQNVDTRRWGFTSKSPAGEFETAIELPFQNFLDKPAMTVDPTAVAVGPTGNALAATARASWSGERHTGQKGIYVFQGLPRSSE